MILCSLRGSKHSEAITTNVSFSKDLGVTASSFPVCSDLRLPRTFRTDIKTAASIPPMAHLWTPAESHSMCRCGV